MRASVCLGKVFGIPIEVNISWIPSFLLLAYMLAGQFGDTRSGWPLAQQWWVALITAVLFFLSVLAHELSHCVMARRKDIRVRGITLFIFGGVSHLDQEGFGPFTEFTVALVGPLVSIVLTLIFGVAWYLLGRGNSPLEILLLLLAWSNFGLGVFNLVPGYPLDGGRLLRAAIWGLTGDHRKATQISAGMGQVVGLAMLLGGMFLAILTESIDGIWLGILGLFLLFVARNNSFA